MSVSPCLEVAEHNLLGRRDEGVAVELSAADLLRLVQAT